MCDAVIASTLQFGGGRRHLDVRDFLQNVIVQPREHALSKAQSVSAPAHESLELMAQLQGGAASSTSVMNNAKKIDMHNTF